MKILVTGENGYIGSQLEKRVSALKENHHIEFVSVRTSEWKKKDFSSFDAIYHVAALVHTKEKPADLSVYFKVNSELTYELAKKAKSDGVKSFVFLSTMAVYGQTGALGQEIIISAKTKENPLSAYGKSKLEGEKKIRKLNGSNFKISIIRVPMVYGKKCPGNYSELSKMAKKTPLFPRIYNKRSMIFVDHLSDFVLFVIKNSRSGLFLIKNPEDVNTLNLVNEIARLNGNTLYNSRVLGAIVKIIGNRFSITKKIFGNLVYKDEDCGVEGFRFEDISFKKTIELSET